MSCSCCICYIDGDCPDDFNGRCCNGTCTPDVCCVISIENSCQPYCDYGCTPITSGFYAGKFTCWQDICNDFP